MAEEEEEGVEVGFEEGMSWLPTHVLDEAFDSKKYLRNQRHPKKSHPLNSPAEPILPQPKCSSLKPHHRPKHHTNWAAGGPGMQAIFLDSSRRSCGTGVFLPRRAGTDFHPSKKPACSPVLLPSRVVQALNLNVHELGLQIKPQRDTTNSDSKRIDGNGAINNNKKGKDASAAQCCFISQSRSTSPEIFLPKEWTY